MNFIKAVAVPNKPVGDYYYGKLQLIVPYPHGVNVGETVEVKGSIYKGKLKVTYIYDNQASKISALYFGDVNFSGNDSGTVEKLNANPTVINPVNPNPGSKPVETVIPINTLAPAANNVKTTPAPAADNIKTDPASVEKESFLSLPIVKYVLIGIGFLVVIKLLKNK